MAFRGSGAHMAVNGNNITMLKTQELEPSVTKNAFH